MKKILSILLASLMVISMFAACVVTASADETAEGNWDISLDAFEETKLEDDPSSVTLSTPGYQYTDNGFEVVNPVYENAQAKYTVISKTKYEVDNFSIKIQIDEADIQGDFWLSFTFWSEKNGLAQGGNSDGTYGYGFSSLIKDSHNPEVPGDGLLSYYLGYNCGNKSKPGGFTATDPKMDEFTPNVVDGKQIIEYKVVDKIIYINGTAVANANNIALNNAFRNDMGLAHFGISIKSGLKDSAVKFTILEVNGVKPAGSDSKAPVNRAKTYGDKIDASTIPANTPGVLFDGSLRAQNSKLPSTSLCSTSLTEDGTIKVTANSFIGYIGFQVNSEYTADVNDFPYVAVILKNYCTCEPEEGLSMDEYCMGEEQASIYYCAGNTLAPDDNHKQNIYFEYIRDITPEGSEDYYTVMYMQIDTTEFAGETARIHSLRIDFHGCEAGQEFEVVAAGYFKSPEDLVGYVAGREEGFTLTLGDVDFGPTLGTEEDLCPDCGSVLDAGGFCPECDVDETTTAKKPTSSSNNNTSSGCGSVVGMGAAAIVITATVAGIVTFKKRKED